MSAVRDIVQVVDDRILTFDPAETDRAKAFVERGFVPPGTKRYKDKRFMFDRVFRHESSQQEVFDGTARPLLNNLLDGYNATVFAYGVRVFSRCIFSYPLIVFGFFRRRGAERHIQSVARTQTLASFISSWPTSSNASRTVETTTT